MSSQSNLIEHSNSPDAHSSSIRSRPRRLVSFTNDDPDESSTVRSRGASSSPYTSRGASPLPMRHPSRPAEFDANRGVSDGPPSNGVGSGKGKGRGRGRAGDAGVDFLDASWSSLQSLASSFLGSDIARTTSRSGAVAGAANGSVRTHARKPSRPSYIPMPRSTPAATWGPSGPSTPEIGAGTKEERHALVQAKKREVLLLADTETIGTYKRRGSGEYTDVEAEEDALAYIHPVQPTDTITGVTIKYGCQQAVMRRANGFWPSDSIQSRRTVLLPVEACSVKGRPIQTEVDLLGDSESVEDMNGSSIAPEPAPKEEPVDSTSDDGGRIWKHDKWVRIDGFASPVEIGRVPRRALGFFPRTRRKSMSYSDTESMHERPSEPQRASPGDTRRPRHHRQRSNFQFTGPGVGTLDRSSMAPGPAQDGLSRFFAQHLPSVAPQSPSFDTNSTSTSTSGLDNIGGTVENWVRKMTTRAKASLNELQQTPHPSHTSTVRPRRMGDLIELDDSLERASLSDRNHDRERGQFSRSTTGLPDTPSLRERFPSPAATSTSTYTSRARSGERRDRDRDRDRGYFYDRAKDD